VALIGSNRLSISGLAVRRCSEKEIPPAVQHPTTTTSREDDSTSREIGASREDADAATWRLE
jgi:hypothetical protein